MTEARGGSNGNGDKAAQSLASGHPAPCVIQPHHRTAGLAGAPAAVREARLRGQRESGAAVPVVTDAATASEAEPVERLRQWLIVFAVLATVIAVDQAAKWWAWRHVAGVEINPGGDILTGPAIGRWFAQPVSGALLDMTDFGLLSIAAAALARRRLRGVITACGSLMVGGWASNLLDRLGMHYWTAPGSIRGAVDFIGMGGTRWNLADFAIIGATPLFLLATACLSGCAARRHAVGPATPATRISPPPPIPIVALAAAGLVTTVALGALHHGGLTRPPSAGKRICQHPRTTQTWSPAGELVTHTGCQRP